MSATCEICGKEFRTTQGRRGHMTFVHQMTTINDPSARLATEQVSELTMQVSQLTEQLNGLAEQLELNQATTAMMDTQEVERKRQLEQLRNEWEDAHNKLVGIINRNSEFAKEGFLATEDEKKATDKQLNDLRDHLEQLEDRVQSKLAAGNQLHAKLDAIERKLSCFESELGVMRILIQRQPTGKLVSFQLDNGRYHDFKEYKGSEGLKKPYRKSYDLFLGGIWIDLSEPED